MKRMGKGVCFFVLEMSLYAINAKTGLLIREFADGGSLDLSENLDDDIEVISVGATSPGVIFEDFYILGMRTGEGFGSSPGHIRALGRAHWSNFAGSFTPYRKEGNTVMIPWVI